MTRAVIIGKGFLGHLTKPAFAIVFAKKLAINVKFYFYASR